MDRDWLKNIPERPVYLYGKAPIFKYLRLNADKHPEKTAIIFYGREISYKELDESSNRFANYLINLGLNKGDRVGIFMGSCPQYIIAFFGIQKMGGVSCIMDPYFSEPELDYAVNDARMSVIVSLDLLIPRITSTRNRFPTVKQVVSTNFSDYLPEQPSLTLTDDMRFMPQLVKGADDFMLIQETMDAGSKAVEIDMEKDIGLIEYSGLAKKEWNHRDLLYHPLQMAYTRDLNGDLTELTCMPLNLIAGLAGALGIVIMGATNIMLSQFEPLTVFEAIEKYQVDRLYTDDFSRARILNHPDVSKYDLSSLKANPREPNPPIEEV
ncbi:MAG: AMP-binding protein [Firmicutes bacterium]|nr:AMP-binding protein [Bacillota bacterium]